VNVFPINPFIIVLVKLRQDSDFLHLARFCDVSACTTHTTFSVWVKFCFRQWSEINLWADKDLKNHRTKCMVCPVCVIPLVLSWQINGQDLFAACDVLVNIPIRCSK
jgi:hypothetical protein